MNFSMHVFRSQQHCIVGETFEQMQARTYRMTLSETCSVRILQPSTAKRIAFGNSQCSQKP